MIFKEYFGVEICCVQSDMPYLHLWVLNKNSLDTCVIKCALKLFTNPYTTVYYIKYSSGNQHLRQEI